jgi:hypothetical protein
VNTKTLCGYSDWRVPSVEHLKTLINTNYYPTINPSYFPNTVTYYYWSASPVANSSSSAWIVFFYYGYDDWDGKSDGDFVRLVRAGQ